MFHRLLPVLAWAGVTATLLAMTPPALHAADAPKAVTAPPAAAEPTEPAFVDLPGRKSSHEKDKIKMVVFLDFFCTHCHHFDTTVVPVLQKEYGNRLQVSYVGFPIVDPKASHIPILAYYLADQQGKGEAMKAALFTAIWDQRLDVTRPDILLGLAKIAGLDLEAFKQGFNNRTMEKRLTDGIDQAQEIGVRGTPTVLVDNHLKVTDNTLKNLEMVFAVAAGKKG